MNDLVNGLNEKLESLVNRDLISVDARRGVDCSSTRPKTRSDCCSATIRPRS